MAAVENETHVQVRVITTSGTYPESGYGSVPANQPVQVELAASAKHLHIADTSKWIARTNGHDINPELSWAANHLHGKIDVDWGPVEGGGGRVR